MRVGESEEVEETEAEMGVLRLSPREKEELFANMSPLPISPGGVEFAYFFHFYFISFCFVLFCFNIILHYIVLCFYLIDQVLMYTIFEFWL